MATIQTKDVVSPNADGVERKTEELISELDTATLDKLMALVKYRHKDRIALYGIVNVQKEMKFLCTEWVRDLVAQQFKQLSNQIKDRQDKDKSAYFRLLISKGTAVDQAYTMAYGNV